MTDRQLAERMAEALEEARKSLEHAGFHNAEEKAAKALAAYKQHTQNTPCTSSSQETN